MDENVLPWEEGVRQGGKMNKHQAAMNLLDFKEVMDKYEIPFVIIFGLLIGIKRNGDFIDNDTDTDVACFYHTDHHYEAKMIGVKEDLRAKGFNVVGKDRCPWNWTVFIRGGEKIEIWWLQKIDDEWIFNDFLRWPAKFFDTLDTVHFIRAGIEFKVPAFAEEWLEYSYGMNWRIPEEKSPSTGGILSLRKKDVAIRQRQEEIIKIVRRILKEEADKGNNETRE